MSLAALALGIIIALIGLVVGIDNVIGIVSYGPTAANVIFAIIGLVIILPIGVWIIQTYGGYRVLPP